jgi:colicin import membrane protein
MTLLFALASCGSDKNDEKKPQDNQPVAQAAQPKAQDIKPEAKEAKPKAKDAQPKAPEAKAKAKATVKKWLPPAMADIDLTAEQEGKIKPVVVETKKQLKAVREDATLDSAAKKEKLITIAKGAMEQYKAILTPAQWKKFMQARRALMEKSKAAVPAAPAAKES